MNGGPEKSPPAWDPEEGNVVDSKRDEAADDETLLANQTTCSSGSNDAPSKPDSESGTGSTELSANESQEGLHDEDGQRDAGLTR
ncbi:unnamed protein product, partial [Ixodes pacificus]